ncbi:boophilin-H2-like [Anticarsia gemmatalis]|uniref:boophilin-H2-like n=1 Tax=Anticarsia gemmatalis TaxID=129554 RepID=UPI003F76209E
MKSLFIVVVINGYMLCTCVYSYSTLTTAKVYNGASAKPFISHRRTFVSGDPGVSTPLDLFFAMQPGRRSPKENIWAWDYWCQLQPTTSNCSEARTSYYYNVALDRCSMYTYRGCGENQNHFRSSLQCERHCKGTNFANLKESTRKTFCELQVNAGQCLALVDRYYFDVSASRCKKFVYGGCGGNQNRFLSRNQCESRCQHEPAQDET